MHAYVHGYESNFAMPMVIVLVRICTSAIRPKVAVGPQLQITTTATLGEAASLTGPKSISRPDVRYVEEIRKLQLSLRARSKGKISVR